MKSLEFFRIFIFLQKLLNFTIFDENQKFSEINKIQNVSIGIDVIVGFPGETDEDFEKTYNLLNQLNISYLHVFTYSRRNDTDASEMKFQISDELKMERRKRLVALSLRKNKDTN